MFASSGESQESESLVQLRFLEAETRVKVKMEELEKELERTRMLMREIQAIVEPPKVVVVVAITEPLQQHTLTIEENELVEEIVPMVSLPPPTSPPIIETTKDVSVSIAFQMCKSCNTSLVLLRCDTCLEWKHVGCPKYQHCSCAATAAASLPSPPPVTEPPTPITATRRSPRAATTTLPLPCTQTFTAHKPHSKSLLPASSFPDAKSKRLYFRDLLLTKCIELRQLYREQHAIAAARTSPMLIAERTDKGRWTPTHNDRIEYSLVGHCGTQNKHEQEFLVAWRLNNITTKLLNAGLAADETPVSAVFHDPRDTTALNHAIYKLF